MTIASNERHFFVRRDAPRWLVVNEVGALIFRLCNERRSPTEIANILRQTYNCSPEEAERDVQRFWTELEASQFLAEPPPQREKPAEVLLGVPSLYVTSRCNLSCSYCAVYGAFAEGDMSLRLFREIVRQSAALGAWRVAVTGGEPFLREDLIDLLRSVEGAVPIQILTNGTLMDAAKARDLARLGAAVQISLDGGCSEVHDPIRGEGTFEAAVRCIRLLRDAGVAPLTINFTIQKANAKDVARLLELAEREGIKEVSLMPLVPGVVGERRFQFADADSILTVVRCLARYDGPVLTGLSIPGFGKDAISGERWCVPGQSPSIGPDGSVFPCMAFARTRFVMGKMPEDTLEELFHSKRVEDLRRKCRERVEKIEECSSCVWKHFCLAGCPAYAYHQRGTLLAKDGFCEVRKRLYTDLFLGGQENGERRPK